MIKKFSIFNFQFSIKNRLHVSGFTLIELLAAMSIFVIIGLFATQVIATILINKQKTEVISQVRQEGDYALAVVERHLRNASSITSCSLQQISYFDFDGRSASFACVLGNDSYVASSGARLTTTAVAVSTCQFTCTPVVAPKTVNFSLTLTQSQGTSDPREQSTHPLSTQVILRNQ